LKCNKWLLSHATTGYFVQKLAVIWPWFRGMVKCLSILEEAAQQQGKAVFDHDFINEQHKGLTPYLEAGLNNLSGQKHY